ncbi:MAG: serine O-acetyltransferase [Gammaproteobacteria bacterium]|nr:MAG: serine O-acetyltransferase [Gammaproteobacteria bacterium]
MSELYQDYLVYIDEHELECYSKFKRIAWLLLRTTFPIVLFYRLSSHEFRLIKYMAIPVYKIIRIISGVQIHRSAVIGKGLFLPHFGTIVLNRKATYGDFLTIYHGVTVGAKGNASNDLRCPVIGDNVRLSTGSIILGDVSIGDNVTVGAGAVVVKNVPSGTIVVGNPAKALVRSEFQLGNG